MIDKLSYTAIALKDDIMEFLPQLIFSIVVLILGYLIARLVKFLSVRVIRYVSGLIHKRFDQINVDHTAPYIGIFFFWLVMLATFIIIFDLLGLTIFTQGLESILSYLPHVIAAALIVFIAVILGKFIAKTITSLGVKLGFQYANSLGRITQYLIVFSSIIIAIDQLGIQVTFLIQMMNIIMASLFFAAAFAFGLGAKTSVSNILASFYIRKMYKVGDNVRIGSVEGVIAKIDATVVKIDTEKEVYFIPSKTFNETQSVLIKRK